MRGHFTSHRLQKRPPGTREAGRGEDEGAAGFRRRSWGPSRRVFPGQSPGAVQTPRVRVGLGSEPSGRLHEPGEGGRRLPGPPHRVWTPTLPRGCPGERSPRSMVLGVGNKQHLPPPKKKKREEERERKKMYVSFLGEAVVRREKEAPASRGHWTEGGAPVLILGVRGGVWGALTAPSPKPRDSFPGDQKNSPQARCKSLHHVI